MILALIKRLWKKNDVVDVEEKETPVELGMENQDFLNPNSDTPKAGVSENEGKASIFLSSTPRLLLQSETTDVQLKKDHERRVRDGRAFKTPW